MTTKKVDLRKLYNREKAIAEAKLGFSKFFRMETSDDKEFVVVAHNCMRCGGSGSWARRGVCFRCGGEGYTGGDVKRIRVDMEGWVNRMQAQERAEAKKAKKAAEEAERYLERERQRKEKMAAFREEHKEEVDFIKAVFLMTDVNERDDNFLCRMYENFEDYGSLTEGQLEAVRKNIAQAKAPVIPVETGRQTITGELVSIKEKDSQWGITHKMLVIDDRGFKVYGTSPKGMRGDLPRGTRIEFVATVEKCPWSDDRDFGVFKRPSKFRVLDQDSEQESDLRAA